LVVVRLLRENTKRPANIRGSRRVQNFEENRNNDTGKCAENIMEPTKQWETVVLVDGKKQEKRKLL